MSKDSVGSCRRLVMSADRKGVVVEAILTDLARRGAAVRVEELKGELAAIYGHFPDLNGHVPKGGVVTAATESLPNGRNGHHMQTPAAREAASLRMKKRWRKKRREDRKRK